MSIEIGAWYAVAKGDSYYNHHNQAMIPSLGSFYNGLRVPDLLLTAFYRIDPKTKKLVHDVRLMFQTDGPSDAQLNFKNSGVTRNYTKNDVYEFSVLMDITFNTATTRSRTIKGGANVGVDIEVVKGGVDGSYEDGKQSAETVTTLHAFIEGNLNPYAPHFRLHVGGHMTGKANAHRDR